MSSGPSRAPSGRRIDQPRSATTSFRSRPNRRPSRGGGRAAHRLARRPAQRGVEGVESSPSSGSGYSSTSSGVERRDLAEPAPAPRRGLPGRPPRRGRGRGPRRARSGGPTGPSARTLAASARNAARSRASSAESPWRSLDHRGEVGLAPGRLRVDGQPLDPAELQRPAVEDEAVAGLEPLGIGPFERPDRPGRRPGRGPTPPR